MIKNVIYLTDYARLLRINYVICQETPNGPNMLESGQFGRFFVISAPLRTNIIKKACQMNKETKLHHFASFIIVWLGNLQCTWWKWLKNGHFDPFLAITLPVGIHVAKRSMPSQLADYVTSSCIFFHGLGWKS